MCIRGKTELKKMPIALRYSQLVLQMHYLVPPSTCDNSIYLVPYSTFYLIP
jgi:hypothetical protein